jgi:SnoaL-like domain
MTATPDLADRYIAAWNETDPAARRAAMAELFADDVRYTDPLVTAESRHALDATIGAVHQQFPGFVFRLAGPVDAHHDQLRFTWELGPAGEAAPVAGFDVAVLDGDGRIRTVLGFLDRVPAAA